MTCHYVAHTHELAAQAQLPTFSGAQPFGHGLRCRPDSGSNCQRGCLKPRRRLDTPMQRPLLIQALIITRRLGFLESMVLMVRQLVTVNQSDRR